MNSNLNHLPTIMEAYKKLTDNKDDSKTNLAIKELTDQLTQKLTSDLSKDPTSIEIQGIIRDMDKTIKKQHEELGMDMGENYWGVMADFYVSNDKLAKTFDQKYGKGASQFMSVAFNCYSESRQ